MTTNSNTAGKKHIIVIAGPTGSGKTDLSIKLAKHYGCPILSSDSRQVFKGMVIGTAQPTAAQLTEAEHHLIATHDITEHYTAGRYEKEALSILEGLFSRHDTVVVVGGSGLYIDALCDGMDSLPKSDPALRRELTERLRNHGLDNLSDELKVLDPVYYEKVDRSNPNRIIRALEVCLQTGKPYSTLRSGRKGQRDFGIIKIGITMPRDILYDRINRRVDIMTAEGLEDEARSFYPHRELNSLQTVGYREFFEYFDGTISREEAIELIKRNSRRYAKRQMTWFGRYEDIEWFNPDDLKKITTHIDNEINR